MINLLILRGKVDVRTSYYRDKEEDIRKKKDCNRYRGEYSSMVHIYKVKA